MADQRQQQRQKASAVHRAEKQNRGFGSQYLKLPDGAKLWKPEKAGTTRIRILPYIVGKGNAHADEGWLFYERTFFIYSRCIGPNEESVVALAKTFNQRDPIAEYRSKLQEEGADKDALKPFNPKERQLFNVLDLENPKEGVKIFDYSNFGFGDLLDERVRAKPDKFADFWDAENGLDLEVVWKEVEGMGKFVKAAIIDFEPASIKMTEDVVLKRTYCLDNLLIQHTYDELKTLFYQGEASETSSTKTSERVEDVPWTNDSSEKSEVKHDPAPDSFTQPQTQNAQDDWGSPVTSTKAPSPAKDQPAATKEKAEPATSSSAPKEEAKQDDWSN